MKTSDTVGKLALALSKAQGVIRNVVRDKDNPFFRSRYAPMDTVIDFIKSGLAANEIAYFQSAASDGAKVSVVTRLLHSSGEWIENDPLTATAKSTSKQDAGKPDDSPQPIGSCVTYLRRYSLMTAVGIAACDDDDAEAAHGRDDDRGPPRNQHDTSRDEAAARAKAQAEEKRAKQEAADKALESECVALMAGARDLVSLESITPSIKLLPKGAQDRLRPIYKAKHATILARTKEPGDPEPGTEKCQ